MWKGGQVIVIVLYVYRHRLQFTEGRATCKTDRRFFLRNFNLTCKKLSQRVTKNKHGEFEL